MGQVVRHAVQFAGNPKCEEDDAARVAAIENESQDCEAIVRAASSFVDTDYC